MAKAIVRMPDELHRALKIEAVNRGLTMQTLVQHAIRRELGEKDDARPHDRSGHGAGEPFGDLSSEESELLRAVLAFLRKQTGSLRSLGVHVLRALTGDSLPVNAVRRGARGRNHRA